MKPEPTNEPRRVVPAAEVCRLTNLSRTTVWRGVREGWLPAAIKLSGGRVAWFLDEIEDFLASRPRARATQF